MKAEEYYPDEGCDVAPKCLSCPLPECKYIKRPPSKNSFRNAGIIQFHETGASIESIAKHFSVSRRTVFRVIHDNKPQESALDKRRRQQREYAQRRRLDPKHKAERNQYSSDYYRSGKRIALLKAREYYNSHREEITLKARERRAKNRVYCDCCLGNLHSRMGRPIRKTS